MRPNPLKIAMTRQINFNQSELLARGWTRKRIEVFLGKPDFMAQGRASKFRNSATPKNEKCWRAARVLEAEGNGALTNPLPKINRTPLA